MTTALKYTVLPGDSLAKIAQGIDQCAGVSFRQIENANPSIPGDGLQPGNKLEIPDLSGGKSVLIYSVLSGDSYYKIAAGLGRCKGLTSEQIEAANPSVRGNNLQAGELINIPAISSQSQGGDLKVKAPSMGYWNWTYSSGIAPSNATLSMAFSGWSNVQTAIKQSAEVKENLQGNKFITFGGGNASGQFTSDILNDITALINNGSLAGYDGIAYDVEEGSMGLAEDFQACFTAAKANNFQVLVTVSHSAPYGIDDANELMQSFFASDKIDFLSPQLYTSGEETSNNYQTDKGMSWPDYAQAKAMIIPSIVTADLYPSAQQYFADARVTTQGYIQWSQIG